MAQSRSSCSRRKVNGSVRSREATLPNSRCSWQAWIVAAAATGPILEMEPSSAAAIVDMRLQLNAVRWAYGIGK
jgi:hypothetical protein